MLRPLWTLVWRSLGLEFWLLLPLLGLTFWWGGGLLTDRVLLRANPTGTYLESDRQREKPPKVVQSITVKRDPKQGTAEVTVTITNSELKTLTFKFPFTDRAQIETAMSQELGLPRDRIQALIQ